jgi:predicted transcriptional regulator
MILKAVINAVYIVASRRTTTKLAAKTLSSVLDALKSKYSIFQQVDVGDEICYGDDVAIRFKQDLSSADQTEVAHAIESLIRLIYDDITDEAGMYFVTEMKNHLSPQLLNDIGLIGIDLDQIQTEQHHAFLQRKKKKASSENGEKENILGYSWNAVSRWEYKANEKSVELYDKNGKVLDKIDLEQAIKNYVDVLSGITETDSIRMQEIIKNHEKEYFFLKLIYDEKIDMEHAQKMLNITPEETTKIIKRLVEMEMLRFASKDTVELTQAGREFISK